MSVDMNNRTWIAADLLRIDRKKVPDVAGEVQRRVRAMDPPERQRFSVNIDAIQNWANEYEEAEVSLFGRAS